jgi:hypothetical protein
MPELKKEDPKVITQPKVVPDAETIVATQNAKRVSEIDTELAKLEADRKKAAADLAEAHEASVTNKKAQLDALNAKADTLAAEKAKLTPLPKPTPEEDASTAAKLTAAGWKQSGDLWVNGKEFTYKLGGQQVSVPVGLIRTLGEAAELESHRS